MFLSFCGKVPRDEGAAFVAPNATVQGDVILKAGSTVWYGAVLRGDDGQVWSMVQIAGLVARRIVCRTEPGDPLARGQRYGMIRFGSRVDLYLPRGYVAAVRIGEQVFAGQSVIARAH